jgi:hypothetical protein
VNKVFWSVEGRFFDDRHENNERGDTCCVVCVCEKWWWNCACYRLPCQFSWACELAEPQEKSNGAWKSHVYYLRVKDLWSDVQMTHTVRRPRAIIVFSTNLCTWYRRSVAVPSSPRFSHLLTTINHHHNSSRKSQLPHTSRQQVVALCRHHSTIINCCSKQQTTNASSMFYGGPLTNVSPN